jgi:flagellar assembly protein FliH
MAAPVARAFELPALEPAEGMTVGAMESALVAARAEAEAIRAQAREEGLAAGLEEARAQLGPVAAALTEALRGVAEARASVAADGEAAAVELAFALAEQVLGAVVEVERDAVVGVVRGALRRLLERERVTVLVHPDDLDAVRAAAPELVAELGGMESCEVQAERRVARGGAVVRTGEGEVDATLATKLEAARAVVAVALAGEPAALEPVADA